MIATRLKGGLGNQLFQFAVGYSHAINNKNDQLCLEISAYDTVNSRSLDIQKIIRSDIFQCCFKKQNIMNRILNKITSRFKIMQNQFFLGGFSYVKVTENNFHYTDLEIFPDNKRYIYDGYWQSWRYFNDVTPDLKRIFDLSLPASDIAKQSAQKLKNKTNPTCSIHIRRGDYTDPEFAGVYELLGMDYYNTAMAVMRNKYPSIQFYVFSDSLNHAKELFSDYDDCYFLPAESAMDDFYLMNLCDNNIIGNSTFSWWAAWFNQNENKTVVAPSKWFANESAMKNNTKDLYPAEWEVIGDGKK